MTVPFNASYQPGPKDFDFDINQISITPKRAEQVTFSRGYYSAAQAVITMKDSPYADATSIADLADAKFGAQVGTTSLEAVRTEIQPTQDPAVFDDTNAATKALENGQVDAIVADLPSAFYITAAVLSGSTMVGQFQPISGETEQFGLLFEQGNPLVDVCRPGPRRPRQDGPRAAGATLAVGDRRRAGAVLSRPPRGLGPSGTQRERDRFRTDEGGAAVWWRWPRPSWSSGCWRGA